ncbi:MAG: hypothetical protein IPN73_11855 [Saprospiraceae bacterium]|nr:hypothetical protein [Saprospiraceae bacterium]
MDLSLEQCLQYLLYRDRILTLPGIGVLKVVRTPAHFSDDRSSLEAPSFTVVFDEDLVNTESKLPVQYQSAYSQRLQQFNEAIFQEGKGDLLGFGQLVREGNTIHYLPNLPLFYKMFGGLQAISDITEVKRVYQPEETFFEPMTVIDHKKSKNLGPIVLKWMLGLGIIVLLIYFLMFFPWPSGDLGPAEVLPSQPDTPSVELDTINAINDTVDATAPMEKIDSSSPLIKEPETTDNKQIEYIIITGSFKQKKHIDRMQKRLHNRGYEVFLGDNDSTTRVGVKVNCTFSELPQHLAKIRAQINKDAWVLTD